MARTTKSKKAVKKRRKAAVKTAKTYTSNIYTDVKPLPSGFVNAVSELESELGMPVWLIVQNTLDGNWGEINANVWKGFFDHKTDFTKPIALVIDSPGGNPRAAYKLARFLKRHAGGFTAVVPGYAKSAATLLLLGADEIIMGSDAELGPLDMQIPDKSHEENTSALNEYQSLERLNAFALQAFDRTMQLLLIKTGKKISDLVPLAMKFSADIIRPLMERVDPDRHTEVSRLLKIGEAYAIRLMHDNYGKNASTAIASKLVENYPEHGFVIDIQEAETLGLKVRTPDKGVKLEKIMDKLCPYMDKLTVIGRVIS